MANHTAPSLANTLQLTQDNWTTSDTHVACIDGLTTAFGSLFETLTATEFQMSIVGPTIPAAASIIQDQLTFATPIVEPEISTAFEAIYEHPNRLQATPGNDFAAFQTVSRWTSTATNGSGLQQGDPTTITWSVVADGTFISGFNGEPDAASNLVAFFNSIYGTRADWLPIFTSVFDRWSALSGVNYVYEARDDGAAFGSTSGLLNTRGDVRIGGHFIDGEAGSDTLAYNFFPSNGEMVIDTSNFNFYGNTSSNSLSVRNTLAHELGHGLGLHHVESNNANFLLEPFISTSFDGPQFDDILGLHRLYGDALESRTGNHRQSNDSIAAATHLGPVNSGMTVSIGTDASDSSTVIAATQTDFVSIDDNSDTDFYRFTITHPGSVDVILNPRGPTYSQGSQRGTQTLFNTKALSNLSLAVFNSSGSLLRSVNNTAAGSSERITGLQLLSPGAYYVRVTGSDDNVQLYDLSIALINQTVSEGIERVGTAGPDQLLGGMGDDQLRGGNGNDQLNGDNGRDSLLGEGGQDTLLGGDGSDHLQGGSGDDSLSGDADDDTLEGQGGSDTLLGGSGHDVLVGASGSDFLQGGDDNDALSGGGNNDRLEGQAGNDTLIGNSGLDSLVGAAGDDLLQGGLGKDNLSGGSDNDTLEGQAGSDVLLGDGGNDLLVGGSGNDTLIGGAGSDTFRFDTGFSRLGIDTITDFTDGDVLQLSQSVFGLTGVTGANIVASEFAMVGSLAIAENSGALIIYNDNNGSLYFNANGSAAGFGSGGQFAQLENIFNLSTNHIELMA
jgi:Ca2+-binding RTX toxin-like protein